ncbi:hypothetical protein ACFPOE_17930 [Caenimonas terrae]|uniref:Uncharacterized protein n=1 Tax=Caenimonas terrae TaxID=696074 RepID=A0ABW0NFK5_9BURK
MSNSSAIPRRPGAAGWEEIEDGSGPASQAWVNTEIGVVVVSAVEQDEQAQAAYSLALRMVDGGRCSGSLVFLALADFGSLDAVECPPRRKGERLFRAGPAAAA